jgi:hypothetical protein
MLSDQRPSTPPTGAATTPQSLSIQSTPHSQGSGGHYSYQSQNHQSDYKPYLKEDLKHQYTVTFDEFLNDILHLAPDWIGKNTSRISDIVGTQHFGKMVSKYREPVTHETSHYPPFIVLANHVINQLDHNPDSTYAFAAMTRSLLEVHMRRGKQTWQGCATRVWKCRRDRLSTIL